MVILHIGGHSDMRIAILTLRIHKNYGGVLQNYALNNILTSLGHEVKTVNIVWDIRPKGIHAMMVYSKRLLMKLTGKKVCIFKERQIMEQDKISNAQITAFKNKNIPLTEIYYVPGTPLHSLNGQFDAYVVGSDQVWRPQYTRGVTKYFLDFLTDEKAIRFSYSASFGSDDNEYSERQRRVCGRLIGKFKGVSVREESAINLIKDKLKWDVSPIRHIDPTFLLPQNDYRQFIHHLSKKGGLYNYILDTNDDKSTVLSRIASRLNLTPYTLLKGSLSNESDEVLSSVEDWLAAIASADFVFTDSFHGCAFSIIFNKPFLVYGNAQRGKARFSSLLSLFGLEERYIDNSSELIESLLISPINWERVNQIVYEERNRSLQYFKEMLG